MVLYVLNSLIIPVNFDKYEKVQVKLKKISLEEAKEILKNQFISAVGHEGTARMLSELLGIEVPTNRITIFMEPGDIAVHFFLKERVAEGKILSKEELARLPYWLVLSEVEG